MHHRNKTLKKVQAIKAAYQTDVLDVQKKFIVDEIAFEKDRIDSMREKKCRSKKAQKKNDDEVKAYDAHQTMIKSLLAYNRRARRKIAKANFVPAFLVPKLTSQQSDAISHAEPIELDAKQKERLLRI